MADEIKRAFRAKKWSMKRLSDESGTRYASVFEFFKNGTRDPALSTVDKWCKALGLELKPRRRR